ncbi:MULTISPECIES: restriction endonuclease subunit S [unclassified Vibrio]|uniref:restriction endonuclease subunit S n=1 Tax=unclassified Vibrio TaxID=2614977 RepID=UPI0010BD3937|nr:restriction endonuclease subunit S [Vibrio sp. F13]TKF88508.1 restriction endonuclease subunit S [Vibrio sp. F13]
MTEQMNVPKLRFCEFDTEWSKQPLGKKMTIFRGASPRPKGDPRYYGGKIPRLMIQDATRDGKYTTPCIDFLTDEGAKKSRFLKAGSVVLSCSGTRVAIPTILAVDACVHDGWLAFKNYKDLESDFLYHLFVKLHERMQGSATTGGVFNNLTTEIMNNLLMSFPSVTEQQKIASFLSKVDEKIGLLSEKKDKLTEYKRGVMQQLLNGKWQKQDGQLTFTPPTLRFKADDGSEFPDWEEKTLGDVVSKEKYSFTGGPFGSDLKSDDYTDSGVRIIQLQNIGDGHFNNKYKIYTSESKADALISCNIYPNDLLLSKMGDPVARALLVPNTESRYVMCSDGIRIVPDDSKFNRYFLMNYINSPFFRNKAISVSTGSTRQRIGLTDLRQLKIIAPTIEEQTQIANFLSAIDQKIDLANSELNKAKEWKKGLLQQMFV